MLGTAHDSHPEARDDGDARLKAVLQQWRGPEPAANFTSGVWRRVRASPAASPQAAGVWTILRGWLTADPAWVQAVAAAVGIVVGIGAAFAGPPPCAFDLAPAPFAHSQTLAGAYVSMVSGGMR